MVALKLRTGGSVWPGIISLSLSGVRKTTRYQKITVRYQDEQMKSHTQDFTGWTAQIIQHECDHLEGILI